MQIQWFPGHMHKARVEIQNTLPKVDILIEVLDARIPYSSENPMLAELRGNKPCLKVLTKSDLADPEMTEAWQAYFREDDSIRAKSVTSKEVSTIRRLKGSIGQMLPDKSLSLIHI